MDLEPVEVREDELMDGSPSPEPELPPEEVRPLGFIQWLYLLCTRTSYILKVSLAGDEPRYLFIASYIVGAGVTVTEIVNRDMGESLILSILYMIIGGLLFGVLEYVIGGSIYHVLLRLVGGSGTWEDSRAILIYSSLPGNVINVATGVIYLMVQRTSYAPGVYQWITVCLLLVAILTAVLQMKIQFTGAIHLQKANVTGSLILFVILPLLYNIFALLQTFNGFIL